MNILNIMTKWNFYALLWVIRHIELGGHSSDLKWKVFKLIDFNWIDISDFARWCWKSYTKDDMFEIEIRWAFSDDEVLEIIENIKHAMSRCRRIKKNLDGKI